MQTIVRWIAAGVLCAVCGCASRQYTEESVIKAQQTAATQNTAQRNTTTLFVPPAETASTNAAPQEYRGINLERSINKLSDHGGAVVLDDGSTWLISPAYQSRTLVWRVAQKVIVTTGINTQYPYQLANETAKEAVPARLVAGTGPH